MANPAPGSSGIVAFGHPAERGSRKPGLEVLGLAGLEELSGDDGEVAIHLKGSQKELLTNRADGHESHNTHTQRHVCRGISFCRPSYWVACLFGEHQATKRRRFSVDWHPVNLFPFGGFPMEFTQKERVPFFWLYLSGHWLQLGDWIAWILAPGT